MSDRVDAVLFLALLLTIMIFVGVNTAIFIRYVCDYVANPPERCSLRDFAYMFFFGSYVMSTFVALRVFAMYWDELGEGEKK